MTIRQAQFPEDLELVRQLFTEYVTELDVDLTFQGFEEELAGLPGKYGSPEGAILIADTIGCVAVRPLSGRTCEMKRLYVQPVARGTGAGRLLAEAILVEARRLGYQEMVLDSLDRLSAALTLYRRLGFEECAAYYVNPLPGVVFMSKEL